jgi:hypothetical protein
LAQQVHMGVEGEGMVVCADDRRTGRTRGSHAWTRALEIGPRGQLSTLGPFAFRRWIVLSVCTDRFRRPRSIWVGPLKFPLGSSS